MALPELESGTILAGKYRIDRIVGEGGIGVVVAALHLGLGKAVAIKLMHVDADAQMVERFQREARAIAGLSSPHVPQMLDIDRLPSGEPYLVMELLEGIDLGELLRRQGKLRVADALDYAAQACDALAEAHDLGIVHRDLKPANLFLANDARGHAIIKVLDFGMAKLASELESPRQVAFTQTGSFFGSPAYMAPEQWISARQADARSDVWSMGCVLYELLTGRLPFESENLVDLFRATVESSVPSPRSLRPELTPELEAVIMRCLHKDPAQRYAGGRELRAALGALTADRITSQGPSSSAPASEPARSSPTALGPTIVGTISQGWLGAAHAQAPVPSYPGPTPAPNAGAPLGGWPTVPSGLSQAGRGVAPTSRRWLVAAIVGVVALIAIVVVVLVAMRRHRGRTVGRLPGQADETNEVEPAEADVDDPPLADDLSGPLADFATGLRHAGNPVSLLQVTVTNGSVSFVVPGATPTSEVMVYTIVAGRPTEMPMDSSSYQSFRPFHPNMVDARVVRQIALDSLRGAGNPPRATVTLSFQQPGSFPAQWTVVVIRGEDAPWIAMYDVNGRRSRRFPRP